MKSRSMLGCCLIAAVLVITMVPVVRADAGDAEEWPQFQRDAVRNGVTWASPPVEIPSLNGYRHTWNAGTTGIEVPIIVAEGIAYCHAGNGVWAFDAVTGQTIWQVNVPGTASFQTSTPAWGSGKLFIATFDGYIRAYDAYTGAALWNNKISNVLLQCPLTCYEGMLYIGQGGSGGVSNSYFCLNSSNGSIEWEYASETVGYLWSGASVIGDYIVFANHDAILPEPPYRSFERYFGFGLV